MGQQSVKNNETPTKKIGEILDQSANKPCFSDLDDRIIKSSDFGLRKGKLRALDRIADELGVGRNNLMRFLVHWAIEQYRAGNVNIAQHIEEPPPPKKKIHIG
jgi:hypothetical protein